ncbi:predicted protein [Naegleria gruberi]|uniref:Predicted protein n=1 Tax=Naegleria gruberi TaxID=5762 RepID=D2VEA8_NAEGR|nr:uncharacterized protein NAEGRDRAFT_67211 [Naegleria gruberi]EFC44847.1 predicted protein [Naegleria gruberi]|eukprot:XP_002677591.1 predicted protein [Naegleria gruberi strain NEG-M]
MSKPTTIALTASPSGEPHERFNNIVACSPFSPPTNDSIFLQQPFSDTQSYSKHGQDLETSPNPISIQLPSIPPLQIHHQQQLDQNSHDHHIDIANYYSNEPSKSSVSGVSFSDSNHLVMMMEEGKENPSSMMNQTTYYKTENVKEKTCHWFLYIYYIAYVCNFGGNGSLLGSLYF